VRSAALLAVILGTTAAAAQPAPPATARTEFNMVPVLGGDSDVGIGIGGVADLARLDPAYRPYRWRFETAVFVTFKPGEGNQKVIIPYQDYYVLFVMPQLTASGRLRLEARPSFTSEATQLFYGIGNASPPPPPGVSSRQTQYGRRRVEMSVAARLALWPRFFLRLASGYAHNALTVPADGILAAQRASGPEPVRQMLDGPLSHGVISFDAALQYDSRDNEIVPAGGSFHQVRLRVSPRFGPREPFAFQQLNVTLRIYRTIIPRFLVLSARAVGDMLFGDPPFYELTRVEDLSVVGGGKGIRGVPGQRYYGKVKVFGNLETRTELFRFSLRSKPFILAGATFFDTGRVWSDLPARPELDGRGLGLKYGVGGGLRLQEGTTFVVRADIAWSPDAHPIGAYFNAGQTF
jgi:Omp85 superfamily domain